MNSNVSFCCTRCGKTIEAAFTQQGDLIVCTYCRQKLIVPEFDAPRNETVSAERSDIYGVASSPDVDFDRGVQCVQDVCGKDEASPARSAFVASAFGRDNREDLDPDFREGSGFVLLRSYLDPRLSRRVDICRTLCVNWYQRGEKGREEFDESGVFSKRELSDDEFISRLNSSAPASDVSYMKAPTYVYEEPTSWTERVDWKLLSVWFIVVGVVVGLAALTTVFVVRLTGPNSAELTLEDPKPVVVDGLITYKTKSGKLEGDEGAFVFFLPVERPFVKPLVYYGAKPNEKLPLKFDEFLTELNANGGVFEKVGFEGLFSVELPTPGRYKALVVSFNVDGDIDDVDKETLEQIGKYLFKPEALAQRNKILWEDATFTGERGEVEYHIGKATR